MTPTKKAAKATTKAKPAAKKPAAAPKAKAAAAKKAEPAPKGRKNGRPNPEVERAAAADGKIPAKPRITHKSYCKHADAMEKLVKAGDLKGLKNYRPIFKTEPYCTFRTPLSHYRTNAIIALTSKGK